MNAAANRTDDGSNRAYARGLARAFGGAIIFALPLLMTMEMWFLGFYLEPGRLLLFLLLNFVVLVGLSRYAGFEHTSRWLDDLLDALAACAVGVIAAAIILTLFGVIGPGMMPDEIAGKIAIQSVPASFGAMLANKQFGNDGSDGKDDAGEVESRAGYGGQLFLMMAGALFLAFNMAPTEEMILISYQMSPWQEIGLVLLSILLLHSFVYSVGFGGQEEASAGSGPLRTFFGYTLAGYGIALIVSLYVLWTFGRTDGAELSQIAGMTTVLGFPAAIGAAIARLVI